MIKPHRRQPLWLAHWLHRVSGVLLALFLPVHFYLLALAIENEAALDNALAWTSQPLIKVAEFGLVFLLGVHLFGGLRLMALEFLPWNEKQKTFAATALALAFVIALGFLLRAW